jgi:predicted nucleic acid-binding protein
MRGEVFFDTSVLTYLMATADPRSAMTESLLVEGGKISVQVLNELAAIARRKTKMSCEQIEELLADIRILCAAPLPVTIGHHDAAIAIAKRYGFHIYDSLIVASAVDARCEILYSEDMQHGQRIGGLTIRNPFLKV